MNTLSQPFVDRIEAVAVGRSHALGDLWMWPGYLLFFLMLAFPMVLSLLYVKAFLFALVLVMVVAQGAIRLSLHLHLSVASWTLGLAIVSMFFCVRGMFLSAPGAVKCMQVYVVWPLIYLILLASIDRMEMFRGFEKTMVFAAGFIGLFGVFFSLSQGGLISPIPYIGSLTSFDEMSSGFYDEHVQLAFPGLNSLPFLVPALIALIIIRKRESRTSLFSTIGLWFVLILDLAIILLSGRRALQLVTILAPLLTLIIGSFLPRVDRLLLRRSLVRFVLFVGFGIVVTVPLLRSVYPITYAGVAERFSVGFDFGPTSLDDSPQARRQQYFALVEGWGRDPFIGAGLGASAYGSIRSETMPWAYELYYLDLLFQTGVVGFAAYTAGIVWIIWASITIIRRGGACARYLIPIMVGMAGILIATATNPYLARFDGIWAIFLPVAFINHWLQIKGPIGAPGPKAELSEVSR